MSPISRGFRLVATFGGRDRRSEFWPYAGVIIVSAMFIQAIGFGPTIAAVTGATPAIDVLSAVQPVLLSTGVASLLAVAFLAAAVTRRLHDLGLPGWLGFAPSPFLFASPFLFREMLRDWAAAPSEELVPDASFVLLGANNVTYLLVLAGLVLLLCLPGRQTANRFGPRRHSDPV